jgi:hypothetical protein
MYAVTCLECRCVYRQAQTLLAVVQEGACPRCGYVGWAAAPLGACIDAELDLDAVHALRQRVIEQREASASAEPPVARAV